MAGEWVPALALFGGGGALLGSCLKHLRRGRRLLRCGVRVSGVVVEFRSDPEDDGGLPVVEFADQGGSVRRVKLASGAGPPVGRPVQLVYDPADPTTVAQVSWTELVGVPGFCCAIGLAMVAAGVAILTGAVPLG